MGVNIPTGGWVSNLSEGVLGGGGGGVGGGGWRGGKEDLKPKVAARNGKNSISTILRGKERTVNSLTYSPIF